MTAPNAKPATMDEYIASFAPKVQAILRKVRATVTAAAPEATEVISYRMPALKQKNNLRFPYDQPIPCELIGKLTKLRVAQANEKTANEVSR